MKILLLDDDEVEREALAGRLSRRGYEVEQSESAGAAALADREQPDLILLAGGARTSQPWDAVRRLRGEQATRGITIIALASHAAAGDREAALSAGCDDYETRPVQFERLVGKIEALCRC